MSTSLMTTRRFAPLFWCQAFSAFGDNFLKQALVFVLLFRLGEAESGALIQLAAAALTFPFFFLSGVGGEIADRFDKAIVARRLKLFEISVAVLAVVGFAFHSIAVLFLAVFLYGVIAALFGPIKYGILPDHLKREELTKGNALVEGGTFIAILIGTIVAGLAAGDGGDPLHFAWLMLVSATATWIASLFIPRTGEGAPNLKINPNIAASTISLIKYVRADQRLWWGALVASWFWLVGAVVLSMLPTLAEHTIGGTAGVVTLFLTIFSVVGCDRIGLGRLARARAHRAAADADRWRVDRPVRDRPRPDFIGTGASGEPDRLCALFLLAALDPYRHRSRRVGDRRRLVHRADVRRGAGVGRFRSSRPRGCRRQRAQRRLHGGRRRFLRPAANARHAASPCCSCSSASPISSSPCSSPAPCRRAG